MHRTVRSNSRDATCTVSVIFDVQFAYLFYALNTSDRELLRAPKLLHQIFGPYALPITVLHVLQHVKKQQSSLLVM